jgi:hypothetical protein
MKKLLDNILHSAWEPLTPRGVAAFSRASGGRLFLAQLVFAAFTAVVVVWFLLTAWFPVVREAIRQLPPEGRIERGQLVWRGDTPTRLAGNEFLSLAVDVWHERGLSREAHLNVEFARTEIRCHSLLGYVEFPYPEGRRIVFNEPGLEPWWGAWQPWLLAIAAAGTMVFLLASWLALAALYAPGVWMVAFFANRHLDLAAGWKLAAAALMPGALFMTVTIAAYGFGMLDLVQLGMGFAFHLVVGWIYLAVSPSLLPRDPAAGPRAKNPFA